MPTLLSFTGLTQNHEKSSIVGAGFVLGISVKCLIYRLNPPLRKKWVRKSCFSSHNHDDRSLYHRCDRLHKRRCNSTCHLFALRR